MIFLGGSLAGGVGKIGLFIFYHTLMKNVNDIVRFMQ